MCLSSSAATGGGGRRACSERLACVHRVGVPALPACRHELEGDVVDDDQGEERGGGRPVSFGAESNDTPKKRMSGEQGFKMDSGISYVSSVPDST
jgi:hypothetical protein